MADKLKYSTTQPTLPGLRTDDFVLGTGDGNYGPTSTTSYLNGFTAPEGGYVVYTLGLSNTPIGWVAANDADLINISRHLGNTDLNAKAAKVYLAGLTDTWVFNSTPNNIVTDSLVFNMDIKNLTSYPDAETNVYDISGEGNDGVLVNGVARNSNGWLLFDGVDDYIASNTTFSFPEEFTVTCIFKQDTASERSFLGRVEGSTKLIFLSNYNIFFRMIDGGSAVNFPIGYGSSNLGRWNYITATRDGDGTIKASLNGEPYTTNAVRTGTFQPNLIGKNDSGQFWDGGISNMRLYDRSFTEAELKQNYYGGPIVTDGLIFNMDPSSLVSYENGSPQAFSLIGDYPTDVQNGLSWNSSYGGVFTPDGTDDGLATPHQPNLSLDANSLEGWVWFDQHKNYGSLLVKGPGGSGNIFNYSFFFYAGSINYGCGDGGEWQNVGISTSQVPTGRFHHIVGTYDLNVLKFYLNGVLNQELEISFPPHQNTDDLQVLQIPYNLDGKVGAARIYNRALTAEEVKQNFEAQRSRFGI